jgi:hypothetical protein
MVFAGNEMFDHARPRCTCLQNCLQNASAHSVGDFKDDVGGMQSPSARYLRRDTDRILRHGEQMIETATKLFASAAELKTGREFCH